MGLCGKMRLTRGGVREEAPTCISAGLTVRVCVCVSPDTDIPEWPLSWNAQQAGEQKRPSDVACRHNNVKAKEGFLEEVACQTELGNRIWRSGGEVRVHCS